MSETHRKSHRMRNAGFALGWIIALAVLGAACGERPPEEAASEADTTASGELVQPPSADAPRTSQEGFAPDTVHPEAAAGDTLAGAGEAPATSELSVDSIVARYRNNYGGEFVERSAEGPGASEAELIEAAKRRTALDFGYVEDTAWSDMVADLTLAQRTELARRIEEASRELAQELRAEDVGQEP